MYMCICTCVSLCVCAPMFLYYSYLTNDTFSYKCSMSQHIFTIISMFPKLYLSLGEKGRLQNLKKKHFLHYDTQQKLSSILNSKNGHHFCPVVCLVDFHLS